jgi:hypothetical protein
MPYRAPTLHLGLFGERNCNRHHFCLPKHCEIVLVFGLLGSSGQTQDHCWHPAFGEHTLPDVWPWWEPWIGSVGYPCALGEKKKKKRNIWDLGNLQCTGCGSKDRLARERRRQCQKCQKMSKMYSNLQPGQCRVGECGYFAQDGSVAGCIPVRSQWNAYCSASEYDYLSYEEHGQKCKCPKRLLGRPTGRVSVPSSKNLCFLPCGEQGKKQESLRLLGMLKSALFVWLKKCNGVSTL